MRASYKVIGNQSLIDDYGDDCVINVQQMKTTDLHSKLVPVLSRCLSLMDYVPTLTRNSYKAASY